VQKNLLFIPGPVTVADAVLTAMAQPLMDHRSAAFAKLLRRVESRMRPIFGTRGGGPVGGAAEVGGAGGGRTTGGGAGGAWSGGPAARTVESGDRAIRYAAAHPPRSGRSPSGCRVVSNA